MGVRDDGDDVVGAGLCERTRLEAGDVEAGVASGGFVRGRAEGSRRAGGDSEEDAVRHDRRRRRRVLGRGLGAGEGAAAAERGRARRGRGRRKRERLGGW